MIVRKYILEDINQIVDLELETLGTTLGYEMLAHDLDSSINTCYVLEEDGILMGYISLAYDEVALEVLNFCISPKFQNQGLGSRFLAYILDLYCSKGVRSSILEVRSSNTPAIHVYESLGFQEIRVRKGYYSNGEDALVLQKLFSIVEDVLLYAGFQEDMVQSVYHIHLCRLKNFEVEKKSEMKFKSTVYKNVVFLYDVDLSTIDFKQIYTMFFDTKITELMIYDSNKDYKEIYLEKGFYPCVSERM